MSEPLFTRLAVLGLGLLGGSVAAAARVRGVAGEVVGYGRRRAPLARALERGLVDRVVDAEQGACAAVEGADLVVLATPVSTMASVLEAAAPGLAPGSLVTDVGSVKGPLAESLPGLLPAGVRFVGSHPMVGSHETGVEHASAALLEGSCCVVTATAATDTGDVQRLIGFWQALGTWVARRAPDAHDADVAWVSHLPHVLSFAYARCLSVAPETAGELAGSGFRDFTRIARSDPGLWADILGLNRKALAAPLEAFSEALAELARVIEAGGPAGIAARKELLERAGADLDALAPVVRAEQTLPRPASDHSARSGGVNPEIQAAVGALATRSENRNS